jgi:hypothetical protein
MVDPMDEMKRMQDSIARNATLIATPTDHSLMEQARASAGHLGSKAMMDEYSRLVLHKYHRPQSRGFFARLFGR